MQVDPIKPMLKAPGTKRLKLKHDEPLLNFAFKFNLRHTIKHGQRRGDEVGCCNLKNVSQARLLPALETKI